jgi:hypothetical protein
MFSNIVFPLFSEAFMRNILLSLLLVPASAFGLSCGPADAGAPPILKGSYGFTGTAACLVAPGHVGDLNGLALPNPTPGIALPNSGFQANLRPNDAVPGSSTVAYSYSFAVEGIRTFNGYGSGTVKGKVIDVVGRPTPGPGGFPHFPPSAGSAEFSFNFTYSVNEDGSWTSAMVPGSFTETHLTGPRAGQTSTIDALPPVSGMVSRDGNTLIAMQSTAAVETHTHSNGDVDPQICHRSRVFIRLDDGDRDHDHDRDDRR